MRVCECNNFFLIFFTSCTQFHIIFIMSLCTYGIFLRFQYYTRLHYYSIQFGRWNINERFLPYEFSLYITPQIFAHFLTAYESRTYGIAPHVLHAKICNTEFSCKFDEFFFQLKRLVQTHSTRQEVCKCVPCALEKKDFITAWYWHVVEKAHLK